MRLRNLLWPLGLLLIADVALFWKFYFHGQLPFPGNLLVSFYFPWNGGGFPGFDPWTTRKDVIAADVIRQMYPWRTLVFDLVKAGQWPLWNPFNFSGTPLLANLQSSVFFPGNVVWLVLPYLWAWTSQVVFLPLVFSFFCYLFLRSLNLSRLAAVFGAIVISNLSSITVWAEQIVVIQTALFLPLALWAINKKRFWLVPVLLAFSIFGGHIQTAAYVYIITVAFGLYKRVPAKYLLFLIILSLGLAAIQLLPAAELYLNSAREGVVTRQLFYQSTFPWPNLVTIFAPDFFGNPAVGNFRGRDYGNFQGYFGVAALVLVFFARKSKDFKFWILLALGGLIFSLAPFAYVFDWLRIPVLSSGYPSRMIFVFQLAMAVLSAYGFDHLFRHD